MRILGGTLLFFAVLGAAAVRADDWPAFRGPAGNGVSPEKTAPLHWDAEKNVAWKFELPGPGNSSPIVSNGRVFATCAQNKGGERTLYCLDRKTGKLAWKRTVSFEPGARTHKTNPYCGSTPAADGQRVVVWHNSAGLYCYDFQGKELWKRQLGEFDHVWGYGVSPVIYKGRVFLHCGPGKRVLFTALNLQDGHTVWETEEPLDGDGDRNTAGKYMGSWCTPVVAKVNGREVLVCSMPTRVNAYHPDTGQIVWTSNGLRGGNGDLAYASPIIAGKVCVAMGGFKGPTIGFTMGGKGDITETNRLWRVEKNPQRIGSGVFVDGYIYMANAGPNMFQCINPENGELMWQKRSPGGAHWGSLVYAAGRLYGADQNGTTFVFEPNPREFKLLATNEMNELSNSTPAFSDGQIFLRTATGVYCIENP